MNGFLLNNIGKGGGFKIHKKDCAKSTVFKLLNLRLVHLHNWVLKMDNHLLLLNRLLSTEISPLLVPGFLRAQVLHTLCPLSILVPHGEEPSGRKGETRFVPSPVGM